MQHGIFGKVQQNMIISFLNEENSKIIERMTSEAFAIDDNLWLYWGFRIELIPGNWDATFYLENSKYSFFGYGLPDDAVKMAYDKIDKKWLEKGFIEGKKAFDEFKERRKLKGL